MRLLFKKIITVETEKSDLFIFQMESKTQKMQNHLYSVPVSSLSSDFYNLKYSYLNVSLSILDVWELTTENQKA